MSTSRSRADDADEDDLQVEVTDLGAVRLVTVRGAIDMVTAPALDERLAAEIRHCPQVLVVDLTAVSAMSSSGISVLLTCRDDTDGHGVALRLVIGERTIVARALQVTGTDRAFATYEFVDDAALPDKVPADVE